MKSKIREALRSIIAEFELNSSPPGRSAAVTQQDKIANATRKMAKDLHELVSREGNLCSFADWYRICSLCPHERSFRTHLINFARDNPVGTHEKMFAFLLGLATADEYDHCPGQPSHAECRLFHEQSLAPLHAWYMALEKVSWAEHRSLSCLLVYFPLGEELFKGYGSRWIFDLMTKKCFSAEKPPYR